MMLSSPASVEDAKRLVTARNASRITVAVCDLQGQLRGKSMSPEKFLSALEHGFSLPPVLAVADFTDVIHPVQVNDTLTEMGDGVAVIAPETLREIPWAASESNMFFLGEMSGEDADLDPRAIYRRVEQRARSLGFQPMHACEYEFSLLREDSDSLHRKGFRNLEPATREPDLYGICRMAHWSEFWDEYTGVLDCLGVKLETCHGELSPGALEAVIRHARGVRAADDAVVFKTFSRAFARRRGMTLTFMARISHECAGHSGHVHISLADNNGENAFHDKADPSGMSSTFRQFIGGLQRSLPELALMLLPNVNSFRRLGESGWSCDSRACLWGRNNRSVPLRVIPEGPWRTHLEVRLPGADANPYLVLACVLAGGLWGVNEGIEPLDPFSGNAFRYTGELPAKISLPRHFHEAVDRFHDSVLAQEMFGQQFVRVFSETRAAQAKEFSDKVSEWELRRFLELA